MNIDLQRVLEEAAKKLEAIPLRNGTDGKLTKDDEPTTNGEIDSKLSGLRIYYDESCVAGGGGGVAEDPEQNGIGDEDGYTHDITDMFHKCCTNGLALGEIINRQNFGLIDAMSAIELMDPKMDAGMLVNSRRDPFPLTFEILKMEDISVEEYIGIIDETLACFTTWLDGQSMVQTVLTNVYLSNPKCITDKVMKAVSTLIMVICSSVQKIVQDADIYVEEDFQPFNYSITDTTPQQIADDVRDDPKASTLIKEVEDELSRNVKSEKRKKIEDKSEDMESISPIEALRARVRFLRFLNNFFNAVQSVEFDIDTYTKSLDVIKQQLSIMMKTAHLGLQTEACDRVDKNGKKLMMGFDPSLSKQYMPPTYPRYIDILPRLQAFRYLERCFDKMSSAVSVFSLMLPEAVEFIIEYGHNYSCIVSRSVLQRIYVYPKHNHKNVVFLADIRESLRQFIMPPSLQKIAGSDKSTLMLPSDIEQILNTQWIDMSSYYISCFKICGLHISRQRNKWGMLLGTLDVLQNHANIIDTSIHKYLASPEYQQQHHQQHQPTYVDHLACYGTWVLHESLTMMVRFTFAGFQLSLYSAHEYKYVYWYLYNCIFGWMKSTLVRAEEFSNTHDTLLDTWNKQRRKVRRKRKCSPHIQDLTYCQALQNLCDAFFRAVTGFTMAKKIIYPKFDFDCEEVRFKHRFLPFHSLSSFPIIKYDQYKTNTNIIGIQPPLTEYDLYRSSLKSFNMVRSLLENMPSKAENDILMKICKKNAIVMKLMAEGLRSSPTFDFEEHTTFPVIKIL